MGIFPILLGGLAAAALLGGDDSAPKPPPGGGGKEPPKPPPGGWKPPPGGGGPTIPASGGDSNIDDGALWAASLPKSAGPERERIILDTLINKGARYSFAVVRSGPVDGITAKLSVMSRTVRVGQYNPVRVQVDYSTMQAFCDALYLSMMTPLVADLTWKQAGMRLPYLQKPKWVEDGTMSTTANMIAYSRDLDQGDKNVGRPPVPVNDEMTLIANEGKQWVVAKRLWVDNITPEKSWNPKTMTRPDLCWSANYGWWMPSGAPVQSVGKKHNFPHTDYSQQIVAVSRTVILEGAPPELTVVDFGSLVKHPTLWRLVSNEGPLPSHKHPFFGPSDAPDLPQIAA